MLTTEYHEQRKANFAALKLEESHGVNFEGGDAERDLELNGRYGSVGDLPNNQLPRYVVLVQTTYDEQDDDRHLSHSETRAELTAVLDLAFDTYQGPNYGFTAAVFDLQDGVELDWDWKRVFTFTPRGAAERLEQLCVELGLDGSALDDTVHDAASNPASDVNNSGFRGQIEFLLEQGWDVASVEAAIRDAA